MGQDLHGRGVHPGEQGGGEHLGGRGLLGAFADAGVGDEWDVTVSGRAGATRFDLAETREQDGFLFTRFTRRHDG